MTTATHPNRNRRPTRKQGSTAEQKKARKDFLGSLAPRLLRASAPMLACALLAAATLPCAAQQSHPTDVADTVHNLTSTGPGTIKVAGANEVCIFCHTPHNSNPIAPLWNRRNPGTYYQTYQSTTMVARVGQPTGSSRLCLSCHDGTIAISQTYNERDNPGGPAVYISPRDRGYIGTDLSDDHPISFTYDAGLAATAGQLRDPASLPTDLPLDHNGQLQCTTCHDPHDDSFGDFLRMDNHQSRMCTSCHNITNWASSAHANSSALLSKAVNDSWSNLKDVSTVRDAGCEACHTPHNAGDHQRLLRHEADYNNCLNCHDGSVAQTNIAAELQDVSAHHVDRYTDIHDPTEDPATMRRHVTCVDCHNPHQVTDTGTAQAPYVKPAMRGVSGVTDTGQLIKNAQYEYQVCFKCHGQRDFATPTVQRVLSSDNLATKVSPNSASYHPIEAPGRSTDVPSLLPPLTTSSMIYCTDCHGTNDPSKGAGPHGSRYTPLLVANYTTLDMTAESPQAYALCYKCHNRSSILGNQSFPKHRLHVVRKSIPCSVCHAAHGVRENTHLINFDRTVVQPASNGQGPTYTDLGNHHGSCTLSCHGADHIDESY